MENRRFDRAALRLPAALLLAGHLSYIVITLFHAGGDANNHHAIFAAYAASAIWTAVHAAQFASTAVMLAGLFALSVVLDGETESVRWTSRFGAVSAVAALALYGALQAVDGVALKQAVNAWASAPESEKAARFASAEAIRWLEWGMRSYQNFTVAGAMMLFAVAVARTAWMPRLVAPAMALAGAGYFVQGWLSGTEGFTAAHSIAIVVTWALNLVWMLGLIPNP